MPVATPLRISGSVQLDNATDNVATSIAIAIDAFVDNFVLILPLSAPLGRLTFFPFCFDRPNHWEHGAWRAYFACSEAAKQIG
jgi:hypothetical protein